MPQLGTAREATVDHHLDDGSFNGGVMLALSTGKLNAHGGIGRWAEPIRDWLTKRGIHLKVQSVKDSLADASKFNHNHAPVLIVLAPEDSDGAISRLADKLCESLCPALVLVPEGHERASILLRGQGILCEPWDIEADEAAIMLWTLAQRQPAVQQVTSELRLTEMSINGVHSEIAKLHEELQSAATIQREYMPQSVPTIDGLDIAIVYRPASYVSGDIYDIVELDEHRTGFFLADAVGHGVPAALMTMVISQGLHKVEGVGKGSRVVPPSEALAKLNNAMTKNTASNGRFATAVYGIYDKRSSELTLAGAGHPAPILVHADGSAVGRIESQGPLLGVFPDVSFGETTVKMSPNDVLVLFSDGFEVAFPKHDAVGDDRKRPTEQYISELTAAGNTGGMLEHAVSTLEGQLDAQLGSLHQPDDITALFFSPSSALSPVTQTRHLTA